MPIEIQKGPRPALRTPLRPRKYDELREAIDTLKPGEWFEVPGSGSLTVRQKEAVRNAVRKHIDKSSGALAGITISETECRALIVFSHSDPTKATRK